MCEIVHGIAYYGIGIHQQVCEIVHGIAYYGIGIHQHVCEIVHGIADSHKYSLWNES